MMGYFPSPMGWFGVWYFEPLGFGSRSSLGGCCLDDGLPQGGVAYYMLGSYRSQVQAVIVVIVQAVVIGMDTGSTAMAR